jgi:predicted secreted protein
MNQRKTASYSIRNWIVCFALLAMSIPTAAEAGVVDLWYRPTFAPACCTDNSQMTRVILQVARQWEAQSFGAVQFNWRGVLVGDIPSFPQPNNVLTI